jgi:hypothetical protein
MSEVKDHLRVLVFCGIGIDTRCSRPQATAGGAAAERQIHDVRLFRIMNVGRHV